MSSDMRSDSDPKIAPVFIYIRWKCALTHHVNIPVSMKKTLPYTT